MDESTVSLLSAMAPPRIDARSLRAARRPVLSAVTLPSLSTALPWGGAVIGWFALIVTNHDDRLAGGHGAHLQHAVIMTVAMMSALSVGLCSCIEQSSLHRQSTRTVLTGYAVYLTFWATASIVIHAATEAFTTVTSASIAVLVAAFWCAAAQGGRRRDRALQRCVRTRPIHLTTPYRDTALLAADVAISCVVVCTPAMVLVALHPTISATAAVSSLLVIERALPQRPRVVLGLAYGLIGAAAIYGLAS